MDTVAPDLLENMQTERYTVALGRVWLAERTLPFRSLLGRVRRNKQPAGIIQFQLSGGEKVPLLIRVDDGETWLLIGRGREGWTFADAGQGDPANVPVGLGTPKAFSPCYLSSAVIGELLDEAGARASDIEMRLRRARTPDGGDFREARWSFRKSMAWSWRFDVENHLDIVHSIISPASDVVKMAGSSRDVACPPHNNHVRVFTWAWPSHNKIRGFSFGSTVKCAPNQPGSFLWQLKAEGHAIPYAEVICD